MKKSLLFIAMFALIGLSRLCATHLLGGYISYRYLGSTTSFEQYRITVTLYRDCSGDTSPNTKVPFDDAVMVCCFDEGKAISQTFNISLTSAQKVSPYTGTSQCSWGCYERGIYEQNITLPINHTGFYLKWERCCRASDNIKRNDQGGAYQGQTLYCHIPGYNLKNSSPALPYGLVTAMCSGDTNSIGYDMSDLNGDSLSYEIAAPLAGGSIAFPRPDMCENSMTTKSALEYVSGFGYSSPFGNSGVYSLSNVNGNATLFCSVPGIYTLALKVSEWRNDTLLGTSQLDFTTIVLDKQAGTNNIAGKPALKIYPNPAVNEIRVESDNMGTMHWELKSLTGARILSGQSEGGFNLALPDLCDGAYLMEVKQNGITSVQKVMIIR